MDPGRHNPAVKKAPIVIYSCCRYQSASAARLGTLQMANAQRYFMFFNGYGIKPRAQYRAIWLWWSLLF